MYNYMIEYTRLQEILYNYACNLFEYNHDLAIFLSFCILSKLLRINSLNS